MTEAKELEKYFVEADRVKGEVSIQTTPKELVPLYILKLPEIEAGTLALLDQVREKLLSQIAIKTSELINPKALEELKIKFFDQAFEILRKELIGIPLEICEYLAGTLVHEMLGLGKVELLLNDGNIEDIVVNSAEEPVWVYHKKYGWLKTNIFIETETQIQNYAAIIGRKVGRQITTLSPLMDAHLPSGDRVNATLFPISTRGNTISIRLFRRKPWVITDLIQNNTLSLDVASLLWSAVQYEMNMIVSGGTASGKTTFLNVLMTFIPPNQRIISIEDTREIWLPKFLHWVPLTTREPNPEGKGEVSMLDLLVNSLRMRPDRIIVGEIRRGDQAEVLFEAMHTGHSVYATLHADTASQTYRRLINPPINVPETMLEALHLITVMFRDRRRGLRRLFQLAEVIAGPMQAMKSGIRILYKWSPLEDKIIESEKSIRVIEDLKMHTGMSDQEFKKDLEEKKQVLKWMIKNGVNTIDGVGKVVVEYYTDPSRVLDLINKNVKATSIVPEDLLRT
ncbi:MAG: ATPase, T2SS/T4P/T4SS family [Candidatus Aenigmatarchaeota archaeon]